MPALAPRQVLSDLVAGSPDMIEVPPTPGSEALDSLLDTLTDVDRPLYRTAERVFRERLRHMRLPG